MRIVAGSLRGRRLQAPPPGDDRVRPTADRAREALFSILHRWPRGAFLDLCAGTGAVGLEAFSRGYDPVICLETREPAWGCLVANTAGFPVQVVRTDVRRLGPGHFTGQAVIFVDPPYAEAEAFWHGGAADWRTWMAPDGVLVFETARSTTLEFQPGWVLAETRDYGAARFHLWNPA